MRLAVSSFFLFSPRKAVRMSIWSGMLSPQLVANPLNNEPKFRSGTRLFYSSIVRLLGSYWIIFVDGCG